jgi:lipoprotein-anchoring transpeptidase ErfK/SrfK
MRQTSPDNPIFRSAPMKQTSTALHNIWEKEWNPMPDYRIIVDLSDRQLHLLDSNIVTRSFPVGIGRMVTQTPIGEFTIINKQANPGGPFGAFWMGLSKPHYGIHGTNDPSSIGHLVSQGCIRMYNEDVLALSKLVPINARVTIRP